jgi:ParB-like chromosome segregation protein Spo0J
MTTTEAPPSEAPPPSALTGKFQVMPPLTPEEYAALEASIREHGVLEPIVYDPQTADIIDGYHRLEIGTRLSVHVPRRSVKGLTDAQKTVMALTLNVDRRHLNTEQRRELLAKSIKADPEASDREHARRTGTSPTTAGTVRHELEETGDVSNLDTRKDSRGRRQPASKNKGRSGTKTAPRGTPSTASAETAARKGMTRAEKTRDTKRANAVNAFGVSMHSLNGAAHELQKYADILTSDNGSTLAMHVGNLEQVIKLLKPFIAQAHARETAA